jgi:hypothetical protein
LHNAPNTGLVKLARRLFWNKKGDSFANSACYDVA